MPAHWLRFDARSSPIANGPRLAVNPVNALLNYLYGILEAETRIACLTVGLDPGMGALHADQRSRDSFALDLMEPVRPRVDELVLQLLEQRVFSAKDYFETREGHCRLMPSVAKPLSEHALQLARWIAPYAELAAKQFGKATAATNGRVQNVATPLTQANRSAGRDSVRVTERKEPQSATKPLPMACRECGVILEDPNRVWCDDCNRALRPVKDRANIAIALEAKARMRAEGQDPSHGGSVAAKRSSSQREQMRLNAEWESINQPTMTEAEYREHILPQLADLGLNELAELMSVSCGYAAQVKQGKRVPHPRHWDALASLVASANEGPSEM